MASAVGIGTLCVPLEHIEGHLLIVGTTGAGKTRAFDLLVTQAALRGEAVIVIDPKGDQDLRRTAERACALAGTPERFVYFHPAFPGESVRIDPLHSFNRPTELASRVAALIPSETGNDPFKAFGQMALSHVVQGLLAVNERPSLVTLRHYLEGGAGALVERVLLRYFAEHRPAVGVRDGHPAGPRARWRGAGQGAAALLPGTRGPRGALHGRRRTRRHVRARGRALQQDDREPDADPEHAHLRGPGGAAQPRRGHARRSAPPHLHGEVIEAHEVLYVGLDSLSDTMVGSAIGSVLIADLAAVAGGRYNHQRRPHPVNVFVDEAAEVVNDPFIQLLNKGRGAGLRLTIATQTFADFSARTGSEAKARQVLGNINNVVALRVLDAETQKYVAESLPMARVASLLRAHGSTTDSTNPLLYTGNTGERVTEEEVELFPPALLGQLPNFEYIALWSGGRVSKGRLPILGAPRGAVGTATDAPVPRPSVQDDLTADSTRDATRSGTDRAPSSATAGAAP